jgi:23S rRNA-/tRNA-specific pseudouridylate synthase
VSADHLEESAPLGPGVAQIHRDSNGVVAFYKPAGVLSHPNTPKDEPRSLLRCAYDLSDESYRWEGPPSGRLWLLNRLDSATSGLILACASGTLAKEIRSQFKRKQVRKAYVALVFGVPREQSQTWTDLLKVDKQGGKVRTAAGGSLPAESRVTLLRSSESVPRLSLLRLEPRTGRSHQLRVQCAKRSLPIVGDQTYGNFRANREFAKVRRVKRMFLHSIETSFSYELSGESHCFSAQAPLPKEFEDAFLPMQTG